MKCRLCLTSGSLHRAPRHGFLRKVLLPLLGYYPWHCDMCNQRSLYRARSAAPDTTQA